MRIVAGEFGGRKLARPSDKRVRVTTDRVRESLFSIVGATLDEARVLDLFAGSGILGLEAISRGAAWVDFVDILPASLSTIRGNVETLGLEAKTHVYRGDALRFVDRLDEGAYDVAFADPPFTSDRAVELIKSFRKCAFAKTLSIEHRSDLKCMGDDTREYGEIALTFCFSP
jgi:16S rRNA (guanine966-N2)-methyltransferase